jgi:hypothetical protein
MILQGGPPKSRHTQNRKSWNLRLQTETRIAIITPSKKGTNPWHSIKLGEAKLTVQNGEHSMLQNPWKCKAAPTPAWEGARARKLVSKQKTNKVRRCSKVKLSKKARHSGAHLHSQHSGGWVRRIKSSRHMPVILATWEVEIWKINVPGKPKQVNKTSSQPTAGCSGVCLSSQL